LNLAWGWKNWGRKKEGHSFTKPNVTF